MRTFAYLGEGGGSIYLYVRKKKFLQPQKRKTTELSLTRIQTLQDLFYRTHYKQMRYMNNLRD